MWPYCLPTVCWAASRIVRPLVGRSATPRTLTRHSRLNNGGFSYASGDGGAGRRPLSAQGHLVLATALNAHRCDPDTEWPR